MKNFLAIILLTIGFWANAQVVPSGSNTPVGTVLEYLGSTAPTGFLLADGSCVSQTTYAKLYAMLGTTYGSSCGAGLFKLPDFRGVFLRGAGTNSINQTADGTYFTGGALGAYISDMFQGHGHSIQVTNNSGGNGVAGASSGPGGTWEPNPYQHITQSALQPYGSPRFGSETRPASYSVNRIIKY